jgi:hypothetical protein
MWPGGGSRVGMERGGREIRDEVVVEVTSCAIL